MGKLAFAGCLLGWLIVAGSYARSLNEPAKTAAPPFPTPCGIESCDSKLCKGNYRSCATKGSCPIGHCVAPLAMHDSPTCGAPADVTRLANFECCCARAGRLALQRAR
jgi:hypothetical protein